MKTITIKVPDFLNAQLNAVAAGKRVSKSAVVRDALLQAMTAGNDAPDIKTRRKKPSIHDRLGKYQGAGGTGVSDLASNPKHLAGYGWK